jgi:phage terminase small subunit
MALTTRKRKSIDGYMAGKTKKDAMLAAGYSKSMASTRVNDVFGDPEVEAEIERRHKIATRRSDVTLDWIVERLKKIADANFGDILDEDEDGNYTVNMSKLTPELQYALTGYTVDQRKEGRGKNADTVSRVRVQLGDKLRALELLIRHLGLSKEKQAVELSGTVSLVERLHAGRTRAGLDGGHSTEEDA